MKYLKGLIPQPPLIRKVKKAHLRMFFKLINNSNSFVKYNLSPTTNFATRTVGYIVWYYDTVFFLFLLFS